MNLVSVFGLKILNVFDADLDPESCQLWVRDEKIGSGILDKHPGSATLLNNALFNKGNIVLEHRGKFKSTNRHHSSFFTLQLTFKNC